MLVFIYLNIVLFSSSWHKGRDRHRQPEFSQKARTSRSEISWRISMTSRAAWRLSSAWSLELGIFRVRQRVVGVGIDESWSWVEDVGGRTFRVNCWQSTYNVLYMHIVRFQLFLYFISGTLLLWLLSIQSEASVLVLQHWERYLGNIIALFLLMLLLLVRCCSYVVS